MKGSYSSELNFLFSAPIPKHVKAPRIEFFDTVTWLPVKSKDGDRDKHAGVDRDSDVLRPGRLV